MSNEVNLRTSKKDLVVKYGDHRLVRPEREAAWGSFEYIMNDMEDIRKSFIRLGFHLKEMQDYRYYADFGYETLEDFAAANLGMDKSNVYRYIRVFEKFGAPVEPSCDHGLSTVLPRFVLADKWKDYSYSQLVEMCNMSSFQQRVCKPDMTIKQLREIKKAVGEYTTFEEAQNIAQLISEGATAAELKALSNQTSQDTQKVATSPQKKEDKSRNFSYTYCSGLHGAARAAYVKSRESVCNAEIVIYDSEGRMVDFLFDPPAFNTMLDVLCCENGHYVFRLKCSWESFQSEEDDENTASNL